MKTPTFLSLSAFAALASQAAASGSVCSSGIYAALAPLDNYAPAVSYCQGQADKTTVTVTATATAAAKMKKRIPKTTSSSTTKSPTATKTTLKTTTSSANPKASQWSSLVQEAKSIVATFCSCAGYPATTTVTVTPTPTIPAGAQQCVDGTYSVPLTCNVGAQGGTSGCTNYCEDESDYGNGCISSSVDANGNCLLVYSTCPFNGIGTFDQVRPQC